MNQAARKDVILVVDDSPDSLGMIHHALDQAGLTALVALEGEQALGIAEKMMPDLVLLDALMPNMDGFETCRRLKQHPELAAVPVIFMTGLTDSQDVVRGLEAGGVDYVTKPVRPDELIARIRVHLNNARITRGAHTALDRLGQAAFATDHQGLWRWATPVAEERLALHGDQRAPRLQQLASQVRRWLDHRPDPGDQSALDLDPAISDGAELRLRYLGDTAAGERLFRLLQRDGEEESELLRQQLRLTRREAQVLLWIAQGKTNREIGQILELSPRTVNKHLEQVFRKLGVENRTAAAGMALRCLTSG
ncbi:DNA-binding response regulator [Alloalcanivorax gelatiniphagus]|uniref:Response regulator transcription factor n=1 Tax=Alloalcanivorax gelatiniphagus TaxID=1194167 RepID=A0ABY2XLQ1_9GAMM|nr:DNA-binding response regulator [Alloalcanivorax gelatiniphagus]TMW12224.1 response regulator transcription factor [Alloalcanivorax gelatiniphagus]|tara:strand:- start:1178 stop:2101 length:924 start_codon:yes stop_codon:yes gene_type:complete